jgi:hypothetical protein
MAGRGSKFKGKRDVRSAGSPRSGAAAIPPARAIDRVQERRGRFEILVGVVLVLTGVTITALLSGTARYVLAYGPVIVGILAIARGAARVAPPLDAVVAPRPDVRRWIYGGLDLLFAGAYALVIWKVIPNRLPSASFHLWTIPMFTLVMGLGTLAGGRIGWWAAIAGGSALLVSFIVLIMRILISAAFLAGVYGAFGKAASTFALVAIALIVELVALLPIVQIKFLMSRAGRRAYP